MCFIFPATLLTKVGAGADQTTWLHFSAGKAGTSVLQNLYTLEFLMLGVSLPGHGMKIIPRKAWCLSRTNFLGHAETETSAG